MNQSPSSLKGRVGKLESFCKGRPRDSRFFMVWGNDSADIEGKLRAAMAGGDLNPGDRFNGKIWTGPGPPPPPRWTQLDEMSREELAIIAGGGREEQHLHSSIASQWSDAELSEFYATALPVLS
jgi:hypothetical protein